MGSRTESSAEITMSLKSVSLGTCLNAILLLAVILKSILTLSSMLGFASAILFLPACLVVNFS